MSEPRKIGLIAGAGPLPIEIAQNCEASGIEIFMSRITNISDKETKQFVGDEHSLGHFGARMASLKAANTKTIVFAGKIDRPDFEALEMVDVGEVMRPILANAAGDDAVMRIILAEFAAAGFEIIGPDTLQKSLLAPLGPLGKIAPNAAQLADIKIAAKVANEIGRLDIGQGCVVCNGIVLAVEAQEGTDEMLKRVAKLPADIRGTLNNPAGVLCKRPKPIQEMRIDLPTIGVATLENAISAGLAGIAVQAGGALIAQREKLIASADAANIFIFGFDAELGSRT
ncbi:MAG: UDP-2,3-diacylglucosamine diphosphatase LpxI [Pseudomonadota bacterium]